MLHFKIVLDQLSLDARLAFVAALIADEATVAILEPGKEIRGLARAAESQPPDLERVAIVIKDRNGDALPRIRAAEASEVELHARTMSADVTYAIVSMQPANSPPTIQMDGPTAGVPGQPLAFSLVATDPDATGPLRYTIDWATAPLKKC